MTAQPTSHRRNRSIRLAIVTSLISKGSSAVLQFISLPLAARVLGREEFGIYATISLTVFMMALLELGIGPALARGISEASAKGDREREGRLYVSGMLLLAGLAAAGSLLAAAALKFVPLPVLFGDEYAPFVEVMRPALWLGIFLMVGQLAVEMTDRVREGYMEAGIVNAWGTVGNIVGAIVIFVGVRYQPSISFLLLAVFAPNIVARLISTVLMLRKRPWLIAKTARPQRATMIELVRDGLSFSATSVVVYFVEYTVCALIVGRISGPSAVAVFHVLMSITTAFTGMLVMVGRPIWAAVVDAMAANDVDWLSIATKRYYKYLAALTALAAVVLITVGPWLVHRLYGDEFTVGRMVFAGHAVFLFAIGWRRVNRYILIGLGLLPRTVRPVMLGLAAGMAAGVAGLSGWGLTGLFAGLATGTLMLAGLPMQLLVGSKMKSLEKAETNKPVELRPRPIATDGAAVS